MTSETGQNRSVIVVGGGAAGLMAAGQAAALGAEVRLLEKMDQPGRKIAITGKGRCNLTNSATLEEFLPAYGDNGKFLRQAFNAFFNADLINFMRDRGVALSRDRSGRYFPEDNRAESISLALSEWVVASGVECHIDTPVKRLLIDAGRCRGVQTEHDETFWSDGVILCTGGLSYPETGSTGDGYVLAADVGHTVIPTRPALVPLTTVAEKTRSLQGLSLVDVSVRLYVDGKVRAELVGDVLFTHFGLSGPVILKLSRRAVDALREKREIELGIDLIPAQEEKVVDDRLRTAIVSQGKREIKNLLPRFLPNRLAAFCLEELEIPPDVKACQLTSDERSRLRRWMKDFRVRITGHRPFTDAFVTAGGVDLKEVDPRTMQSRLLPGLYFAGEILDIDGWTGGYNLQAAFSTGWLAGQSAATVEDAAS